MNIKMLKAAVAGLVLSVSGFANAGMITALDFENVNSSWTTGSWNLGWEFSLSSDINVTELGILDIDGDGFSGDYQVGIFDDLGALLASTTINSGSSLSSDNFRYGTISQLFLSSGNNYKISAFVGNELYTDNFSVSSFLLAPELTFVNSWYTDSSSFANPTTSGGSSQFWFGANFKYDVVNVPEPSTLAIFALGVLGLASRRFKKQ